MVNCYQESTSEANVCLKYAYGYYIWRDWRVIGRVNGESGGRCILRFLNNAESKVDNWKCPSFVAVSLQNFRFCFLLSLHWKWIYELYISYGIWEKHCFNVLKCNFNSNSFCVILVSCKYKEKKFSLTAQFHFWTQKLKIPPISFLQIPLRKVTNGPYIAFQS